MIRGDVVIEQIERSRTSEIKTMMSENPRGRFGPEKKMEDYGIQMGTVGPLFSFRNKKYGLSEQTVEYFQ